MTPLLSIVTVNYNGLNDTLELIESLKIIDSISFELIVIDNSSKVNEGEIIKTKYPQVITIRSEKNLGFSGGNNLGIKEAKGDYIFLLNNDTFIEEDNFLYLIERLNTSEKIRAVSPKIKYAMPPREIQFAGFTPLSKITLRNKIIGQGEKDTQQFDTPKPIPYCHGAAMMIKRSVLQEVGYMPEAYFLYYEELDWCTQIEKAGYELWYEPRCTIFHKESQSTGKESPLQTFYITRNRLLYAWRNRTGITKWLAISYQLTVAIPKKYIYYSLNNKKELAQALIRGAKEFFRINKN